MARDVSARTRPPLTKDLLLVELQNGVNFRELERLYDFTDQEIREWVDKDAEFAQNYRKIRRRDPRNSRNNNLELKTPNWQQAFFDAYQSLGHKASIAAAIRLLNDAGVGVSSATVYARLNPKSARYDPDFEAALIEAEADRIAPIEDTLIAQMQDGDVPAIAHKYLQGHPLTRGRFAPTEVNVNVNKRSLEVKVLEVRSQFRERFIAQSHKRFGRKEVIDAEVEKEVHRLDATSVGQDRAGEGGGEEEAHHQEEGGSEEVT